MTKKKKYRNVQRKYRNIRLRMETYRALCDLVKKNESFDRGLNRLLFGKKEKKKENKKNSILGFLKQKRK